MRKSRLRALLCAAALAALLPLASPSQPPGAPEPEPVAETHLLMEGLAAPNFRGLGKILKEEPGEQEAWVFARGQALLIAETGNLLMLRPPRNQGRDLWMGRSAALRDDATRLARVLAARDYIRSRVAYVELANQCNRCHRSFRVRAQVTPFDVE